MTKARMVGWAHSPFGKREAPDTKALMAEVAKPALDHAGLGADQVDGLERRVVRMARREVGSYGGAVNAAPREVQTELF